MTCTYCPLPLLLPPLPLPLRHSACNSNPAALGVAAGCQAPARKESVWDCKMASSCGAGGELVLYGWGKNAPAVALPEGVGFSVGKGTGIQAVVLQVG